MQEEPVDPQNEERAQPPANVNDEIAMNELDAMKMAMDYESRPLAHGSIALSTCAWILLFFPFHLIESTFLLVAGVAVFSLLLGGWAVGLVLKKPLFRLQGQIALGPFVTRILLMLSICALSFLTELTMSSALMLRLFHLNVGDSKIFLGQLENTRKLIYDFPFLFKIWIRLNTQFFIISFAVLLLINTPTVLIRLTHRNDTMYKVLLFEMGAHFYPVAYIALPFFIMSTLALTIPPEYQSSLLWSLIHAVVFCWIGLVVYGVFYYPEIPIPRPLGLHGYLYMELVTLLQLQFGFSIFEFFMLLESTYFNLVPGAFRDHLQNPGILMGSLLYFEQIEKGMPPETWKYHSPYPLLSLAFIRDIYLLISVIRHLKLSTHLSELSDRIEVADRLEHD